MTHPNHIHQNQLNLSGLDLRFEVIVLKQIPKEQFLHSEIPEEVVLAILCDFGNDQPENVVRLILQQLHRILRKSNRIKKFQKQLLILSRLRKMELIVKNQVEAMTIHYDIETDGLFLQGIEKGIELEKQEFIHKLWNLQEFSLEKIASLVDVNKEHLTEVLLAFLQAEGKTEAEAIHALEAYQEKLG